MFQWGLNYKKQKVTKPKLFFFCDEEKGIKDIQFGNKHGLYLTESGKVFSWGDTSFGQTGNDFREIEKHKEK